MVLVSYKMAAMSFKQAKNAVTLERSLLREIRELKIFAFSIKPIAMFKVLYICFIEPENGRHTH